MVHLSNLEVADMHYVYSLTEGNREQARRMYQRYPNHALLDSRTFSNLHCRLVKAGNQRKLTKECYRK